MKISIPKLKFYRYEFKYILENKLRKEIENELTNFMDLDPFVKELPGKKYFVRSLYFDDPYYSFYYEKIDGMLHREKFRIRTYSKQKVIKNPIYLEIKGRHDNFVFKYREPLKKEYKEMIFKNENKKLSEKIYIEKRENSVFDKYIYDTFKKKIKPVMLVDYYRRPYISKYDYEFRVTLDEKLCGTKTKSLFPENELHKRKLLWGYTILEIKFAKHIPVWFHKIIKTYELTRLSVSKYCLGMERSGLVQKLQ